LKSTDEGDEDAVRAIAVQVLRSFVTPNADPRQSPTELEQLLDRVIAFHDSKPGGYDVDGAALEAGLEAMRAEVQLGHDDPDLRRKLASVRPESIKKLADELQRCRLPNASGALVVVSGAVDLKSFSTARVWRGASKTYKGVGGAW